MPQGWSIRKLSCFNVNLSGGYEKRPEPMGHATYPQPLCNILKMRLQTNCKDCNKKISFYTWKTDRIEFSMEKGKTIELICKSCGLKEKYHLNNLKAIPSKISLIVGLGIFLIGTPLIIYLTWNLIFESLNIYLISSLIGIIGIPLTVYTIIEKNEIMKVKNFNDFKIND